MVDIWFVIKGNKIYGYDVHTGVYVDNEVYTLTENTDPPKNIQFINNNSFLVTDDAGNTIKQYDIDGKRIEG